MNTDPQNEKPNRDDSGISEKRGFRSRVIAVHKDRWELTPAKNELPPPFGAGILSVQAVLSGRFRNAATSPADLPVVGDWVDAEWTQGDSVALIQAVAPRSGLLARKRPGDVDGDAIIEQPIAANIDLALLVMGVDEDFSVRRIERYLTLAWDAGAKPVIVLTKADLAGTEFAPDLSIRLTETETVAFGANIIATSAKTGEGIEELRDILKPGLCAILLGSSGVGKSSLLNALAGTDLQKIAEVRDYDGKGRHTTTSRRLIELSWGAYLVDTPGVREIQLWGGEDSLAGSFPDVEAYAEHCRFADCAHESEPDCAVREAVENGGLAADRLESWHRLRRELAYLERKTDTSAARAEKEKWKPIMKLQKTMYKKRGY
ncbi:MAG: ribosome small subunit-dependent GTPase A [Treponemataceae bacterium]